MSATHPLYDVLDDPVSLRVPESFLLQRGAYGGIVLAALVNGVESAAEHPIRSLSVNLCGVTRCDEDARIEVTPTRVGSKTASYAVSVHQGDQCTAHGAAFTGAARPDDLDGQFSTRPTCPAWADVERLNTQTEMPPFARHFEYRPCHGGPRFSGGVPVTGGYINLLDGPDTLDKMAMAALIDAWYPALFVPTQVFRPMATTAIQVLFFEDEAFVGGEPCLLTKDVQRARQGYCIEDAGLWAPDGRLLATAQQMIAVIR